MSLAGFSCDVFDPAVYNEALITILPNATMNDADCVDTGDDAAESVELTSEITVPLAASLHGGYTVMSYVLYFLEKAVSDGGFTAAIQVNSPPCAMRVARDCPGSWSRPFWRSFRWQPQRGGDSKKQIAGTSQTRRAADVD